MRQKECMEKESSSSADVARMAENEEQDDYLYYDFDSDFDEEFSSLLLWLCDYMCKCAFPYLIFFFIFSSPGPKGQMVLPTCLKRRHSLKGVRLVTAIKRIRGGQPQGLKEFARFQKDNKLDNLSMDDLRQQVLDLTGAELQDLLQFANRDNTVEEARWATHCLILYANEYGQPSEQDLTQSQDQTPTTSANPVNVQMSGDIVQSSGDNNNNGTNKRKRDDLEDRIANLENTTKEEVVKNLKEKINSDIDLEKIEGRMDELDKRITCSSGHKRKKSFQGSFLQFLQDLDCKHLSVCTPDDIRRFLIWKDFSGKTTIHGVHCKHLGQKGEFDCFCPKRLASGTVEGVINQLVNIFDDNGFGRYWDIFSKSGNPACAPIVKEYLKLIREEQASAHVLPKQAKPIFLSKIKAMCSYIDREIKSPGLSLRERYILYRDRAWMNLQFFAGDRASDLSLVVAQEVKVLSDNSGLVFQHTFGKTLRGDKGKSNTFVIKKCDDLSICPVQGLLDYVNFCQVSTVDMSDSQ
ncbi:uncharacterized protein [Mytilus edulis]|uniref:uncharacterized protein n=1 Tax=Mytilus edulis TaxID=6550 RepID=UPI0039F03DC8